MILKYGTVKCMLQKTQQTLVATVLLQKGICKILFKLESKGAATSVLLCYKQSFFGHFVRKGSKYFKH